MAMVKETSDNTYILRDYEVSYAKSRKSSLEWIALASQSKEISLKRIELRDFLSFDDGTTSDTLRTIKDINSFVETYKDSVIESVSIIGQHNGISFNLSINLDTGYIGLCYKKADIFDYKSIERALGLV